MKLDFKSRVIGKFWSRKTEIKKRKIYRIKSRKINRMFVEERTL